MQELNGIKWNQHITGSQLRASLHTSVSWAAKFLARKHWLEAHTAPERKFWGGKLSHTRSSPLLQGLKPKAPKVGSMPPNTISYLTLLYVSQSICCWPLSEAGGWACWTCALIWYKCYFLKNFENPFPLKQRRGRRRVLHDWTAVMPPAWAKEEDCNFWAKYSCCLPLPKDWWLHIILVCHTPLTLVLVQASGFGKCFLPLSCSCIKEYLWKWGLINHTRILNENWKLCREMYWRFINTPPLKQNVCSSL